MVICDWVEAIREKGTGIERKVLYYTFSLVTLISNHHFKNKCKK